MTSRGERALPQLTFGKLLKQARVARGLSQSEVAAPILTKAFISLLERDGARPSLGTLQHLAERLDRPLVYFLAGLDARTLERALRELDERGQAALRQQRYAAALAVFEELRDLAERTGVARAAAHATLGAGEARLELHRLPEAEPLLRDALEEARRSGDRLMECRALRGVGLVAHRAGRLHDAVTIYRTALALIPGLPRPAPVLHGELLLYLSTMQFRLGLYDESHASAMASLALLQASAPARTAEVRMNLGVVHYRTGEYPKALDEYHQALRTAEQYEDLQTTFRVRNNLAMVLIESGQPDGALEHLTLAVTMARRLSDVLGECRALTELARCYLALGALPEAREAAEQAVGRSHARGLADEVARASIALGVVSVAERRIQKGLRYLTNAYRHCTQARMTAEVIVAGHALARVLARWGKSADAYRVHTEVFAALGGLSPQEAYGVMRMTKTLDGALDRAPSASAVRVG
ncbi:MAG TPA: tetratricopeptide repeat protein [bacterium]|nr:tetratricopeptide repeat protein [bacterium]